MGGDRTHHGADLTPQDWQRSHTECDCGAPDIVRQLKQHAVLFCYDPYTCWIWRAAAMGCAVVVLPRRGVDKQSWLRSTVVHHWLSQSALTDYPGVAYGTSPSEVAWALLTAGVPAAAAWSSVAALGRHTCRRALKQLEVAYWGAKPRLLTAQSLERAWRT